MSGLIGMVMYPECLLIINPLNIVSPRYTNDIIILIDPTDFNISSQCLESPDPMFSLFEAKKMRLEPTERYNTKPQNENIISCKNIHNFLS